MTEKPTAPVRSIRDCRFCLQGHLSTVSSKLTATGVWYFVHCYYCEADGPPDRAEQGAIDKWNLAHPADPGMPEQEWREKMMKAVYDACSQANTVGWAQEPAHSDFRYLDLIVEVERLVTRRVNVAVDREAIRNAAIDECIKALRDLKYLAALEYLDCLKTEQKP